MSGQRVLLIGGTGFMGARAAEAFAAGGHHVTVLSRGVTCAGGTRLTPGIAESLTADRHDAGALARAIEGRRFDFTVDFCAFDAADIESLLLVPYAALGRYVLISTGQIYLVTEAPSPPFREEDSTHSLKSEPPAGTRDHDQWLYGVGKRRAEGALLALRGSHGVRGVALRLPVVQGEGDPSLRLWAYLERMLDGGPVLLPDGGANATRFLYAGDVARALARLLEISAPRQAVYNLAQPEIFTLREFLERVAVAAGLSPPFVEIAAEEARAAGLAPSFSSYSGPWVSVLDPARAAGEWGFVGARLDEYLPRVVRWHLEHRPARSHAGYAQRPLELEIGARALKAAGRPG